MFEYQLSSNKGFEFWDIWNEYNQKHFDLNICLN